MMNWIIARLGLLGLVVISVIKSAGPCPRPKGNAYYVWQQELYVYLASTQRLNVGLNVKQMHVRAELANLCHSIGRKEHRTVGDCYIKKLHEVLRSFCQCQHISYGIYPAYSKLSTYATLIKQQTTISQVQQLDFCIFSCLEILKMKEPVYKSMLLRGRKIFSLTTIVRSARFVTHLPSASTRLLPLK